MDERQPRHQVVLRLGEFATTLASAQQTEVLAIGWRRTADDGFLRRQDLPTAAELEQAIMAVEDEIARVTRLGDASSPLVSDDAALVELARLAGVDGPLPARVAVPGRSGHCSYCKKPNSRRNSALGTAPVVVG